MACTPEIGCIGRHKYMSYVTVLSKAGTPLISRSIMNYKVVYVFTDRLVFYSSTDAGNAALEAEAPVPLNEAESKIERVINYGDVLLDCGKFKNKLCHAQEYSGIDQIESYLTVKKTVTEVPEASCILFPFFENGYKKMHDKIAYICGMSIKDMYSIIQFKNFMSRNIEYYQLNNSLDRYNGFNGLLHKQLNFIINNKGKADTVVAKIHNHGILYSNKETGLFHSYYSFHDLRKSGFGAYKVKDGLAKGKVPADKWKKAMPNPNPECCLYFKGELHQETACLGKDDGSIESAEDICKVKIDRLYGEIRISLRGVAFSEAYYEIKSNKLKAADCKSKEFAVFKYRLIKTVEYAVENDCRMVMNYLNTETNERKQQWCKKNFQDEISLEKRLMSMNDDTVHAAIETCVFNANGSLFDIAKFDELVKKAQIIQSSFMELTSSESEIDDYDDDDEVVEKKSLKNKMRKSLKQQIDTENEENTEEVNLLEKSMMLKKKRDKKDVIFNKPKPDKTKADKEKTQIFRNMQMARLQSRKTFTQSNRENIDEKFSHGKASLGKENADEFVGFLGFLRDASFKAAQLIAKKEEQQLSKILREEAPKKKKGLTVTDE